MYTEPCLELNKDRLEEHLQAVIDRKAELLSAANIDKEQLMSNPKFATLLESYGVVVPMKTSPTTGKPAYAFAKTDEGMKDLLEHPNIDVQAIVAARMGVKSTIEETRTVRFISIAGRGNFPVPLRYYAARTGRWGGTDKVNLQNLPSRGANVIKSCIEAPKGHVIIDCDSSNIEARGLAWLAGQEDLVTDFRNKVDVYCKMGGVIYGREITKADRPERFLSKTVVLGAGYGTGANKLYLTLKAGGMEVPLVECERIIQTYRYTYPMIPALWRQAERALMAIYDGQSMWLGREGVLGVDGKRGIKLPNGMYIRYSQLHPTQGEKGIQWMYKDDYGMTKIYGAKLVENCIAVGTEVLTRRGWVSIEDVAPGDEIHDGLEFVVHGGLIAKSLQACVMIDGVYMTPDHEVLTNDGWIPASQNPKPYRPDLRHVDCVEPRTQRWEEAPLAVPVSMWQAMRKGWVKRNQGGKARRDPQLWVRYFSTDSKGVDHSWNEQAPSIRSMEVDVRSVPTTYTSSMGKLWGQGYNRMCSLAGSLREFLGRHGGSLCTWVGLGSQGQQRPLFAGELPLDYSTRKLHEQARYGAQSGHSSSQQIYRHRDYDTLLPTSAWVARGSIDTETQPKKQVYDILDAGPRNRFVVRGSEGPFIVHNCTQALARIIVGQQMLRIAKRYKVVMTVHDAVAWVARKEEAEEAAAYGEACMRWVPDWAKGWPLDCEYGVGDNYGEC